MKDIVKRLNKINNKLSKINVKDMENNRYCLFWKNINDQFKGIEVQTKNLPIGDIIFYDEKNNTNKIIIYNDSFLFRV